MNGSITTPVGTTITSNGPVAIYAGNDVNGTAVTIRTPGQIELTAVNDINLKNGTGFSSLTHDESHSSSFFGINTGSMTTSDLTQTTTVISSNLNAGQGVTVNVGKTANFDAVNFNTPNTSFQAIDPSQGGQVNLNGAVLDVTTAHQQSSGSFGVWQGSAWNKRTEQTSVLNTFSGGVSFDSSLSVAQNNPDLKNTESHDSQQGLTGGASALLAIGVGVATSGMGSGVFASASSLLGEAAVDAGFSALASTTAVTFANTQDLGKTWKAVTSEDSLKKAASAAVTAGLTDGYGLENAPKGADWVTQWMTNTKNATINALTGTVVDSAITGSPLDGDALKKGWAKGLIGGAAKTAAGLIGDAATPVDDKTPALIDSTTQMVLHGAVGCVTSQLAGLDCGLGAASAVVGEWTAAYAKSNNLSDKDALAWATVASGATGLIIAGGDNPQAVNIASSIGSNAAQNNAILHTNQRVTLAALQQGKSPAEQQALADAACALMKCALGLSQNDPKYDEAVRSQYRGSLDTARQNQLLSAGFTPYSVMDGLGDAATYIGNQFTSAAAGAENLLRIVANAGPFNPQNNNDPQLPPDVTGKPPSTGGGAAAVVTTIPTLVCTPAGVCVMVPTPPIVGTVPPALNNGGGLTYSQGSGGGDDAKGDVRILPGATPDFNELRAGQGLAQQGYEVVHQPTASQLGIPGQRTADLAVKGVGQVDVYTPVSTNINSIVRGIEGKDNQATAVLIQTGMSDADMTTVAARIWGKPTIHNIQTLFFQNTDGVIIRFNRPTGS